MKNKTAKPFVKWAGGKSQLIDDIQSVFPHTEEAMFNYIEPFVGGGAVLLWVLQKFQNIGEVVINDFNTDLINVYKSIKTNPERIIEILKKWEKKYYTISADEDNKKEYYYDKRRLFNKRISDHYTQSSLFIFLNRTCFNGLYRVNRKNEFNVPIGSYKKPLICDEWNLRAVSKALQKVTILNGDFEQTLDYAGENTIFYFDPPYKPLSETSSFNSYAKDEFGDEEQIRLAKFCERLDSLGYKWILSNSDVKGKNPNNDFFDNLYQAFDISRVSARRNINSNPQKRGSLTELLVKNYGEYYAI